MTKITKTNMAVTIDSWIYNWLSEQNEKRSTLVNKILKEYIIDKAEEPKKQKTLLSMTPSQREAAMEAHMKRLYKELGWEDE
jgi:metal-responsive CopG/Arc/MetJ family transcriptional regulator